MSPRTRRDGDRGGQHRTLALDADVVRPYLNAGRVHPHVARSDAGYPDRITGGIKHEVEATPNGFRDLPARPVPEIGTAKGCELADLLRAHVQPPALIGHHE